MGDAEILARVAVASIPIAYFLSALFDLVVGWITDGAPEHPGGPR